MKQNTNKKESQGLKVIPIGGLNGIGKNMTLLEYQDQILVIDCGMTFPEDEMYGIDIVLPDFSYLADCGQEDKRCDFNTRTRGPYRSNTVFSQGD